jgi:hypothetical protein
LTLLPSLIQSIPLLPPLQTLLSATTRVVEGSQTLISRVAAFIARYPSSFTDGTQLNAIELLRERAPLASKFLVTEGKNVWGKHWEHFTGDGGMGGGGGGDGEGEEGGGSGSGRGPRDREEKK